jgi:ankyrin repeat protein
VGTSDAAGRTALHYAAAEGTPETLEELLAGGAELTVRCRRGLTALRHAPEGSAAQRLLAARWQSLEEAASLRQEDLLESLEGPSTSTLSSSPSSSLSTSAASAAAKRKKKKKLRKVCASCGRETASAP